MSLLIVKNSKLQDSDVNVEVSDLSQSSKYDAKTDILFKEKNNIHFVFIEQ